MVAKRLVAVYVASRSAMGHEEVVICRINDVGAVLKICALPFAMHRPVSLLS